MMMMKESYREQHHWIWQPTGRFVLCCLLVLKKKSIVQFSQPICFISSLFKWRQTSTAPKVISKRNLLSHKKQWSSIGRKLLLVAYFHWAGLNRHFFKVVVLGLSIRKRIQQTEQHVLKVHVPGLQSQGETLCNTFLCCMVFKTADWVICSENRRLCLT